MSECRKIIFCYHPKKVLILPKMSGNHPKISKHDPSISKHVLTFPFVLTSIIPSLRRNVRGFQCLFVLGRYTLSGFASCRQPWGVCWGDDEIWSHNAPYICQQHRPVNQILEDSWDKINMLILLNDCCKCMDENSNLVLRVSPLGGLKRRDRGNEVVKRAAIIKIGQYSPRRGSSLCCTKTF